MKEEFDRIVDKCLNRFQDVEEKNRDKWENEKAEMKEKWMKEEKMGEKLKK